MAPPQRLLAAWWTFGGADEAIIRNVQFVEQIPEMLRHFIAKRARCDAKVARLLGHLQAMFVGSGLEAHLAARARWKRAMTSAAIVS
jgi:hypothetical protein